MRQLPQAADAVGQAAGAKVLGGHSCVCHVLPGLHPPKLAFHREYFSIATVEVRFCNLFTGNGMRGRLRQENVLRKAAPILNSHDFSP